MTSALRALPLGLVLSLPPAAALPAAAPQDAGDAPALVAQRVYLLNLPREEIRVNGEAGVDFTDPAGDLPAIAEVRCGDEVRRALIQVPSSDVSFPDVLPFDGTLRFGVAYQSTEKARPPEFSFEVTARDASGAEEVLWSERIERPRREEDRVWLDFEVDVREAPAGDLVLRTVRGHGGRGVVTAVDRLAVWGNPVLVGGGRSPAPAERDVPGVVVFLVDGLRSDRVGAYGHEPSVTPHLDALAAEGVRFARAYSTSSWTKPAVGSLFTSRPPSLHGAEQPVHRLADSAPTVAEAFRTSGFATGALGASMWVFYPHFNFAGGFDDFFLVLDGPAETGPPARQVVDETLDWLARHADRPVFLYVHVTDPIAPHRGGDGGSAESSAGGDYEREVARADAQLGRLVETLRTLGRYDETTLVVLSDHGGAPGRRGAWPYTDALEEAVLRVPLVVKPAASAGIEPGTVERPVSLLDVAPTLCDLAGVRREDLGFRGASLFAGEDASGAEPRVLTAELDLPDREMSAAFDGDLRLVVHEVPEVREELLRSDGGAERTAAAGDSDRARVDDLREHLARLRAASVADGVYLEFSAASAGWRPAGVAGMLRSTLPLSDANVLLAEHDLQDVGVVGDGAFFADAERTELGFQMSIGGGDARDVLFVRAPVGAVLSLEVHPQGAVSGVALGPQGAPGEATDAAPVSWTSGDAGVVVGLPPTVEAAPNAERGAVLRVLEWRRDTVPLGEAQRARLRAPGPPGGG